MAMVDGQTRTGTIIVERGNLSANSSRTIPLYLSQSSSKSSFKVTIWKDSTQILNILSQKLEFSFTRQKDVNIPSAPSPVCIIRNLHILSLQIYEKSNFVGCLRKARKFNFPDHGGNYIAKSQPVKTRSKNSATSQFIWSPKQIAKSYEINLVSYHCKAYLITSKQS